jgi:hypothetical protein
MDTEIQKGKEEENRNIIMKGILKYQGRTETYKGGEKEIRMELRDT